ncbi:class II aldolase/adducin family protein [Virgisporangium ochraceum]|uniref:class II aldolase/adducin family protein n=1 Tax=Virgisporangium ochraceum TaxID=65505 RepID=UPI001EF2C485|nr:class II aldolase/adducin family protein [Virgisporangium ochraceum]
MAHLGRSAVAAGLVVGSGGNLSARASGADDIWVTGAGTWLDRLHPSAFRRVRISDGAVLDAAESSADSGVDGTETGDGADRAAPSPSSELGLHLATYRARPDVNVVVHLHPQSVLLLDALDEPIRLITTDHLAYVREVVRAPFAVPGTERVGTLAAAAVSGGANCLVLANHGVSILAGSVELAHKRAFCLEEAARLTYSALVLGRVADLRPCPPDFDPALGKYSLEP